MRKDVQGSRSSRPYPRGLENGIYRSACVPPGAREAEIAAAAQKRAEQRKKRRRRRLAFFYISLFLVILAAAAVLSLTVLFKITDITVTGTSRYSEQQIVESSGIRKGDNLFLIHKTEAAEKIRRELPYLGTVEISRRLPTEIQINVSEVPTWGAAEYGGGYVVVGKNCVALEKTRSLPQGCAVLKGLGIKKAVPGSALEFSDPKHSDLFQTVMDAVEQNGLKVTAADFSQPASILLTYESRVTINLGIPTDLDYKLLFAKSLLQNNIKSTEKGTLNMSAVSKTNKAYFDPDYSAVSSGTAKK